MILSPEARVALYWAPAPDDPLGIAGNVWLGRDPATNAALKQPDLPAIAVVTAEARRYGFHATLKPPMQLCDGGAWDELVARTKEIAAGLRPFDLPPLAVTELDGFLALGLTEPCAAMRALCDACVAGLDAFRAPPSAAELARRRRMGLSAEREAMLCRWGYPDVFATWIFHMTLTRRLTEAETAVYRPAAAGHFAAATATPSRIGDVSLFVQQPPGTPFRRIARLPLRD